MIKLKTEVVKSEVMLNVYTHAEKKYGDSSDGMIKGWAFQDGAKYLLDLLRLPVVTNSQIMDKYKITYIFDNTGEVMRKELIEAKDANKALEEAKKRKKWDERVYISGMNP